MKKLIIIALMAITSYGVQAQTMEKDYYNHQIELQLNGDSLQTIESDGMKVELKITPSIEQPDPKQIQQHEWRMFPKPISVKKTHNKVVVVFDRKEWERMQFMHRRVGMRRLPPPHPMWRNK